MVPREVVEAYEDGLDAVRLAATTVVDWSSPTRCQGWRAVDLAGHLVLVVRMYEDLLARSATGVVRMTTGRELTEKNLRELADLPASTGPQRIGAFLDTARSYLARAVEHADRVWVREDHIFSAGEHLATACIEWHVHAWDLDPTREPPACAPLLVDAWRRHLPYPIGDGDPWLAVLRAAGRTS